MSVFKLVILSALLGMMLISCTEDVAMSESLTPSSLTSIDDDFRQEFESTLSSAMEDKAVKYHLLGEVAKMRTGDFEVLLSDFLNLPIRDTLTILDRVRVHAKEKDFTVRLERLLTDNPSLILAVRGDFSKWVDGDFVPAVYFKEAGFDERSASVFGSRLGSREEISLRKQAGHSFVAIHLSERHDKAGKPLYAAGNLPVKHPGAQFSDPGLVPAVDATDLGKGAQLDAKSLLMTEPTSCPSNLVLNSFNVQEFNGAVSISYNVTGVPSGAGYWLSVIITRLGVNGDTRTFYRNGNDLPNFIDSSLPLGYNLNFSYTIQAQMRYIDPGTGLLVLCPASGTGQTQAVTVTTQGGLVNSFSGQNVSNSQIRYNWQSPVGATATEFRLSRYNLNTGTYSTVRTQQASSINSYTYNYPSSFRNSPLQMLIQYRTNNQAIWQGDYFDQTYGSFRNNNEPLKYYGIWMPNVQSYEQSTVGESLLNGAPEVRLIALRAASSDTSAEPSVIQTAVIFMTNCCHGEYDGPIWTHHWWRGWDLHPEFLAWINQYNSCQERTDDFAEFYVPLNSFGSSGFSIINSWDNYLAGDHIRVMTTETDVADVVLSSQESTKERELKVKIGFKLPKILNGLDVGLEAGTKNTEKYTYTYPTGDIDLNNIEITYYEPFMRRAGQELYGRHINNVSSSCTVLNVNF